MGTGRHPRCAVTGVLACAVGALAWTLALTPSMTLAWLGLLQRLGKWILEYRGVCGPAVGRRRAGSQLAEARSGGTVGPPQASRAGPTGRRPLREISRDEPLRNGYCAVAALGTQVLGIAPLNRADTDWAVTRAVTEP
jgi:hypothetical protein